MPMSVLARDVGMTSGGFTKLADRMARDGIIDRRGSDTDRRVVHASLTEVGLELAQRVSNVYVDALRARRARRGERGRAARGRRESCNGSVPTRPLRVGAGCSRATPS